MSFHNPSFIIKNIEPGHSLSENKDNDYINNWIDVSVENEVLRGKKLRVEKPIPNHIKDEYDVVNIDFFGPIYNENRQHRRKSYRKHFIRHTSPNTPRSLSPFPRPTSASSAYTRNVVFARTNTPRKKTKHYKKCSMRIAELAVPTKRQCIDTWRNKSYLLPEFMVERLKQHVMDQRPIVQIPDAIYCFQRRRPHSSKNTLFKSTPTKNSISHNILKPLRHMDSKTLCIIFGNKIGKMLATPLNLTLTDNLEKLSKVVAWDISQILKFPKINVEQDLGRSMQLEVANKVTVWIAGILEDLTFKLLEEDLKVKKEDEAKAQTAEQLVKIMEKILRQQQKVKTTDLEEEEGPVLDFLDDVVVNVMNVCEPPPIFIDEESSTSSSSKEGLLEEESLKSATGVQSSDQKTILEQIFGSETAIVDKAQSSTEDSENLKEMTDEEYLRNEVYNIIKKFDKESDDDESTKSGVDFSENSLDDANKELIGETENDDKEFENEVGRKEFGGEINEGSGDEIENEEISLVAEENENGEYDESADIKDNNLESIKQNDVVEEEDSADKNDSNVSEVFELFNEDLGDKNGRSVKLPIPDLVNRNENAENIQNSHGADDLEHERQKTENPEMDARWIGANEKNRPNIMFAEPNEYLLSDADELWPLELKSDRPLLKLSESVSKSVTSLGNIFESDDEEKAQTSEGKSTSKPETRQQLHQQIMDNITSEQRIVFDPEENVLNTSKYDIGSQTKHNMLTTATKETATDPTKASETKPDSELKDKKPVVNTLTQGTSPTPKENSTAQTKLVTDKPKHDEYITDKLDTTQNRIGSSSSLSSKTDEDTVRSHKTQSHIDYSWKVHPKTAPSWVKSWGQGRGEPSEDSIPIQIRPTRVKESEMRKWCKDLEKAYANLAMWSDWIDNTCKETISLLKRKDTACVGLRGRNTIDWIRLKKNINKDAILWTKLYQRTEENFKSLKRKYNHVEYSKNQKTGVHKAIFDAMYEFENLSVVLHRMIVSAEYCAMCTCNKTRKIMKSENLCKM